MKEKSRTFYFTEKSVPFILLLFTIIAYIPLVSQLGFYWDDWPMLWFKVTKGAEGFATAFESDRPFLGYLYQLTAHLGNNPLVWQILTVFFRWTVTFAFWWMLRQLWPERKREVFWISMLLAVYPGFKQMPIVYVWMNAFIMLLAYILSYGMMLKAIKSGSKKGWILWTVPSVFLFTFCTISTEYYTGLEIARGLIVWIFLARDAGFRDLGFWKKILRIIQEWLPYIGVIGVFMFWRVFIFQFPSYKPVLLEQMTANPFKALVNLIVRIVEDAYTATWGAWTEFVRFPNHVDFEVESGKLFWIPVSLSLLAILLVGHFFKSDDSRLNENKEEKKAYWIWCLAAIGLGLFMVICPGLPYWVTTLPIHLYYPYDRFLVAFMFGSSIFMVGLISFFLRTQWQKTIVFSILTAMAIGGNILNANSYRKDWAMQLDFASQLVTRIPELEKHTILLTDDSPFQYESDNSLTGLVNLALKPEPDDNELPYSVMHFSSRFGSIDELEASKDVYFDFRGSLFWAPNDQIVAYHYSPPGCLRVLETEQHELLTIFPESYSYFMDLSKPKELIIPKGSASSFIFTDVFEKPIEKNWCYYFEKADLARQTEDWETIAAIGDEVLETMKAGEASEYLIFAEAYINLDQWEKAFDLFERVHAEEKGLDQVLCGYIHRWVGNHQPEDPEIILPLITAMNNVGCSMSREY